MQLTTLMELSFVIITTYLFCLIHTQVYTGGEKENAFSLYNLYGHAPAQEPLRRGLGNLQFG